jgi:hypothetical protein
MDAFSQAVCIEPHNRLNTIVLLAATLVFLPLSSRAAHRCAHKLPPAELA